ncbi:DUF5666 domain-containing protein [Kitasatospora sp. DSM 101779]|uniref:DUF5666 domain-containing protein n=1 Tax=Kitasatospora sp. DSM 101779 TaxID=2853165 RepID=UPI0021DB0221|nr:DUF5666 domain-containing protein [Kitasatospora sp. DSM 101779]MCU7823569.1 hypothetical protein [Kitasatospora sp. DSM 101779]
MTSENEPGRTLGPVEATELLNTAPDARDIAAELAAPPRPRLPWPTLVLAGAVIATAAFAGGAWYAKDDGNGAGRQAAAGRQGAGPGGFGGYGGFPGAGGNGRAGTAGGNAPGGQNGAGFTRGTVASVDGTTVYLTDASGNTVKVTTGDSTRVSLNKEGKVGDLQPGQTVTVLGQKGSDGSYTATQLTEGAAAGGFGGFGGRGAGGGAGGAGNGTGSR